MKILILLCAWCAVSVVSSFGLAAFMRAGRRTRWELGRDALLPGEEVSREITPEGVTAGYSKRGSHVERPTTLGLPVEHAANLFGVEERHFAAMKR